MTKQLRNLICRLVQFRELKKKILYLKTDKFSCVCTKFCANSKQLALELGTGKITGLIFDSYYFLFSECYYFWTPLISFYPIKFSQGRLNKCFELAYLTLLYPLKIIFRQVGQVFLS